jgi:CO/xanthine dehydrogenase Mo-binding subunit
MTKTVNHELLGRHFPRKDAVARVTSAERYAVDIRLPRMLDGRILGSPHAHAIVKSIELRLLS